MKKSVLNYSSGNLNIFCSGCGLCEGVCPVGAISMKVSQEGFYRPQHTSNACINCGICLDNCSGINNGKWYSLENCEKIVYGYSRNASLRRESASGGLVTEVLAYLLETKKIDYAIVAGNYNGNHECSYVIAENKEELIRYSGSNYCPVPIGKAIKEIKNRKGEAAIVCLPCLADALKNYQKSPGGHKIKYIFSLICNHTPSFLGTDNIIRKHKISGKAERIKYRGDGWLGYFRFYTVGKKVQKVAYEKYYKDLMENKYFQHRCIICNDHFGKGADASFGDPDFLNQLKMRRYQSGYTLATINSLEIIDIFNRMHEENRIYLTDKLDNKDIIRWKEHFKELREKRLVERKRLVKNHFVYDRIIPAFQRKIKNIWTHFE